MCGRLRVGKRIFTSLCWSEQPCVRPVSAVHMTAGHNALRGSGPGQMLDNALADVGCPDRRIDRLCITSGGTRWQGVAHDGSPWKSSTENLDCYVSNACPSMPRR